MTRIAFWVYFMVFLVTFVHAADARRPKKLIATGWDRADTERLRQNLELMEKRPFNGIVLDAVGKVDEKTRKPIRFAFINEEWKREWWQSCVNDLRECKFKRFTDNFLGFGANPGTVDWFDDAGWKNIVEHWRIAAWVAKQGGLKGILFDPEPYTPPHATFSYFAQPERDKHTFNEYCAKARERGRQVMEAVASEFPDITLFCYFLLSINGSATGQADPRPVLAGMGYGLLPAFVDGWLDVAPPTVTIVDGCESAYLYNSVSQYLESAVLIKGACQELISPENRAKYRAQVQVSFGIYLDAYWNPIGTSRWIVDSKDRPRIEQLRANVSTALRVADEYVWIYGEQYRWFPTPNKRVKEQSWDEVLPGCEAILAYARDPMEYACLKISELKKSGKLVNLARNGDFGSDKTVNLEGVAVDWKVGGAPAGWAFWQEKTSKGTFTWDREIGAAGKGSARASGVANGCFIQAYNVNPHERYFIQAVCKLQGKGDAKIRVRWQTADSKWTAEEQDRHIAPSGERKGWNEMAGVVEVPEGVGRLVILLGVNGQSSAEDVAWYDDVRVYKIE